ncbi:hypothetical protein [Kineococcus sp. SYSU DK003]|uniref:hypothetical protein n=1 Tax=Kineococcus sp. SYSU DK003 TaxID=3383124 RepID=UPI003D7EFF31
MTWVIVGVVAVVALVALGWGTRRGLDRASRSPDPERARAAQELRDQIERGRNDAGGLR